MSEYYHINDIPYDPLDQEIFIYEEIAAFLRKRLETLRTKRMQLILMLKKINYLPTDQQPREGQTLKSLSRDITHISTIISHLTNQLD